MGGPVLAERGGAAATRLTLHVVARVSTGSSPAGVVAGGGWLWTPLNNNRSVARIDPTTNSVSARFPVGRQRGFADEPLKAAWNGSALLVSLPGSGRVRNA